MSSQVLFYILTIRRDKHDSTLALVFHGCHFHFHGCRSDEKLHIVMFPWLAFGHMIPYLELAKLIASKGHRISFVSTPRNIDRLPKLPPNPVSSITYVKINLPHVENLPENAEATIDVPYLKVQYLKTALDGLEEPLSKFLETSNPDWVLYDFAAYWVGPMSTRLGVPCAFFSIFIASVICCILEPTSKSSIIMDGQDGGNQPKQLPKIEDFIAPPKWIPFRSNLAFRYFEIKRIFDGVTGYDDSTVTDLKRFEMSLRGCDLLVVRSCDEFEPQWLNLLEELHEKTVIPVGQLPTTEYDGGNDKDYDTWKSVKEWLDRQEKGSVVYVAFGSEAKPSQEKLTEIALGLELSGLPFFWVLRTRRGFDDTEVVELPDGFEERTKGRGVVCTSWAPQLKILAHDSIGGFLTHSGWSSVVEAIQFERALILLTFLADQGLNARVLEEKQMGYSIPRNEQDGSFTRDSIVQSLRFVLIDEEGKIYREKVKEMRRIFADKDIQDGYINRFLDYLQAHKHLHKNKVDQIYEAI